MQSPQNPELYRLLCNLLRIGTVSETDFSDSENPRVRIATGGNTTGWIRWMTSRAGNARRWSAPVEGEQVLIASPDGELNNAVVLGSLYGSDFPAPDTGAKSDVITWSDGATCRYDIDKSALSISGIKTVNITATGGTTINCSKATIKADSEIRLDAANVICTDKLTANSLSITEGGEMNGNFTGSISFNGVKPDNHSHGNVENGGDWTDGTK